MSNQAHHQDQTPAREPVSRVKRDIFIALTYYCITSTIVFLGIWLGSEFFKVRRAGGDRFSYQGETYANWDGQWYKSIVQNGYSYSRDKKSNVAFFPVYPLLSRLCAHLSGVRAEHALIIVSNLFLMLDFILLYNYSSSRLLGGPPDLPQYVLLAFGLVPPTFFFRAAYSESVFVFSVLLFLHVMARRMDPLLVAAIVGFSTATRAVGVALIPPLLFYAWNYSPGFGRKLRRIAILLPVACLGLVEYMFYLGSTFGDPLAFYHTQVYWAVRQTSVLGDKLIALATLEPIRALFDPSTPIYWKTYDSKNLPLVSLHFADPFYFLGAIGLIAFGAWKRWLDRYEVVLSVFLLLIPYVTSGYETYNRGIGRYSSVVVPAYLVLGRLLSRIPAPFVAALSALIGFLLATYSAMFASWHKYI